MPQAGGVRCVARITAPVSGENFMTGEDGVAAVVARFYAAVRSNDVDVWVALFAVDATAADPVGAPVHRGQEGLRAFLSGVLQQFETFGLTQNAVYCVSGGAAVKWTGLGRGRNGRSVEFEGIDVFEVDAHGLIKSLSAYWDAAPDLEVISARS
jgi:steroid Delta-isomerase